MLSSKKIKNITKAKKKTTKNAKQQTRRCIVKLNNNNKIYNSTEK